VIQEKVFARLFIGLRTVADADVSAISDSRCVTQNCAVLQQKVLSRRKQP
jgi:hypothetical protein